MESLPFWREMETRFRALPDPANQLNASLGETTAAEHLDHLTSVLVSAMETPAYPLDALYSLAVGVGHVGGWLVRGEYVCRWIVAGDPNTAGALKERFWSEAATAAAAADLVAVGATADEAVDRWLDLLLDNASPFSKNNSPWVPHLTEASAVMCAELARRALLAARSETAAAPTVAAVPRPEATDAVKPNTKLFTVKEAAARLKCHEDTIRAMGRRHEIEIINIGRRGQRVDGAEILRLRSTLKFSDR